VTFVRSRIAGCLLVVALVGALGACDTDDGRQMRPPTSDQRAALTTTTTAAAGTGAGATGGRGTGAGAATTVPASAAGPFSLTAPWADGAAMDRRYTCDGEDVSPALSWTAPPPGTVELALLVTDNDAADFVHWAVAGIPPRAGGVGQGAPIDGGIEGQTSFGETGWGGPCPPSGSHTYRFSLYALSQQAEVADGFAAADLQVYTDTSSLAVAEVTGTYARG
jgi:Raf kinase inhibitor-like YbhB/YbcL family protein